MLYTVFVQGLYYSKLRRSKPDNCNLRRTWHHERNNHMIVPPESVIRWSESRREIEGISVAIRVQFEHQPDLIGAVNYKSQWGFMNEPRRFPIRRQRLPYDG